jgi:GT2 family glycosyltransferase
LLRELMGRDADEVLQRQSGTIDAVVVTHDSEEDLRAFAARESTVAAFRRVIVVDNNSHDATREIARAAGFDMIALPRNRGFAAAANVGAVNTDGPVFAVLNPDVAMNRADDVAVLSRHFANPSVSAVAPALVLPDGRIQGSARRVPSPFDLAIRRVAGRSVDAVHAHAVVDVEWAVGACLLLRRTAFGAVGGFDERYFIYFEDVDLCVRLSAAGFRVRYDPTVVVAHRHRAASRASLTSPAARHHLRSAIRFYSRNSRYLIPRGSRGRRVESRPAIPHRA